MCGKSKANTNSADENFGYLLEIKWLKSRTDTREVVRYMSYTFSQLEIILSFNMEIHALHCYAFKSFIVAELFLQRYVLPKIPFWV